MYDTTLKQLRIGDGSTAGGILIPMLSGTLAQFAATTSAQLASTISDETGSGALVFGTSPTISAPTLSGTTNLTGGIISFPASQIASSGANDLDDYEEGTWTPALAFGGGSTGITYTTQSGRYIKIGSVVTVWCDILLSSKGSSTGSATVTGLPFANGSGNVTNHLFLDAMTSFTGYFGELIIQNAATSVLLRRSLNGVDSAVDQGSFQNTSVVRFQVSYRV